MIDFKLILELERLDKAVDRFAAHMKERLRERAKTGKRGWDSEVPADRHISGELVRDATDLNSALLGDDFDTEKDNMPVVDIANRAMILWIRHNPDTETSSAGEKKCP